MFITDKLVCDSTNRKIKSIFIVNTRIKLKFHSTLTFPGKKVCQFHGQILSRVWEHQKPRWSSYLHNGLATTAFISRRQTNCENWYFLYHHQHSLLGLTSLE